MRAQTSQRGFTLIEILVAASIFAIMSIIAITGIKSVLDTQQITDKVSGQVRSLQKTFFYIEQDFRHAINRTIRDEFGDKQASVLSGNTGLPGLSLTRDGRRNPQGLPRSSLMRVYYHLENGILIRSQYVNVDRGAEARRIDRQLIKNIEEMEFRFLNIENRWVGFWPPTEQGETQTRMPKAIEITLRHESMGKITKVIVLPF